MDLDGARVDRALAVLLGLSRSEAATLVGRGVEVDGEAAEGSDFQTLYIDMHAQAHREAVALFRTYAGSGDDAAVVAFAKATLPALEMHMTHVTALAKAN